MGETAQTDEKATKTTTEAPPPPAADKAADKTPPATAKADGDAKTTDKAGDKESAAKASEADLGHDDDLPEDPSAMVRLSSRNLRRRLDGASAKERKAFYESIGVKSQDEAVKKINGWKKLEADDEERRRKSLDDLARAKEDTAKATARAEAAEARAKEERSARSFDQQESRLRELVAKHVNPKFWKHVSVDLAEHARALPKAERKKFTDKQVERWAADYVKENPEFARKADAGGEGKEGGEGKPPDPKAKASNGADTSARQPPATAAATGKSMKPGQANSMSSHEARAEMRKQGYVLP